MIAGNTYHVRSELPVATGKAAILFLATKRGLKKEQRLQHTTLQ
jgi:hypothetical protein